MASVEELSDIELRKKLIEYGFEAGPVTGTTRKLMEKKLTTLMSQKGKPSKAPTVAPKVNRTLSRFSSAEEDSDDALALSGNSRRKSMPAAAAVKRKSMGRSARAAEAAAREAQVADNLLMPSPPPPAPTAPTLPARARYSMNEAALRKNYEERPLSVPTPPRSTRKSIATSSPMKRHTSNGFDSGSDSDVPMPSSPITSVRLSPSPRKSHSPRQDDEYDDEDAEDSKPIATLLTKLSDRFLPNSESTRISSPESSGSEPVRHRMNIGRDTSPADTIDAPYLSAFARRLSMLKAHSVGM